MALLQYNLNVLISVPAANKVLNLSIVARRNTSIAGENNNFTCIVTKNISGLAHQPLAVWAENGTEITEQDEFNSILTFNKLNTSHGKVYTCRGILSSPALSTPLVGMKNYSLIVQSKLCNNFIEVCVDNMTTTCSSHTKH